jgi:hypothetical protein
LCAEQNAGNTEASSQEQAADSGGVETTEVGSRVGSEILLAGTASLDVTARFCTGRAALRHPPLFAALPAVHNEGDAHLHLYVITLSLRIQNPHADVFHDPAQLSILTKPTRTHDHTPLIYPNDLPNIATHT